MSETVPEGPRLEFDAREIFTPLDDGEWGPASGRPDDYPGFESLSVLQTPGGRYRAGKSYRPDPSGLRRAVKVDDYSLGTDFLCNTVWFESLEEVFILLQKLSTDPSKFVVRVYLSDQADEMRQHLITRETGYLVRRRTVRHHGIGGHFSEVSRQLQMLDLDGVPLPEDMSVVVDPEACVKWAVDHLLPPEFAEASFIYQLSASAGLTKLDNELNVHLWFFTDREYGNQEMRTWAKWWNAKQQRKIVDPALFTEVQPHYTNEPELLEGLIDPLAGVRLALIRRGRRTVKLCMPTAEEVTTELSSRRKRAIEQFNRAQKSGTTRKSKTNRPEEDSETSQETETASESGADPLVGGPYFDAVNLGQGWRGYLMGIGFEGHIRMQLKAAVASYFYEQGYRGDREVLRAEIERAIEESPFLDSDEPWSRPRQDARDYLCASSGGDSNVDEMISYIAALQADRERRAYERCEPSWEVPKLTADEAFTQIETAVGKVITDAHEHRRRHGNPLDPWFVFERSPKCAVNCSPGTGKTEAMVAGVVEFLRSHETVRVAIAVPTHKLGEGLADRINGACGSKVAAEWYGTEHSDPLAPDEKMCRLAEAAAELISLGGKVQLLCSRRDEPTQYCLHHPTVAGVRGCGYQRQQTLEVRNRTRVWIIPATMLAAAPPVALKRAKHGGEGDFDLLVIDEAPWFNLLPSEPVKLPIAWLSPDWWGTQDSRAAEHQKRAAIETLAKIHATLAGLPFGEIPAANFAAAGVGAPDVSSTRRTIWKFKVALRGLVKPGSKLSLLKKALSSVAARNQRVITVVEALYATKLHLSGNLAPSGIALSEQNGIRYLCLRRKKDIDPVWLKAPILYLDAADLSTIEIAKAWLPDLALKVDARAKAPYMRVTQLVDSQMAYRKFVTRGNDKEATAKNNREKLAGIIASRGTEGLVICPKELRLSWEQAKALPAGWMVWNFGAIRGRDEARAVPQLVIVSRPLPGPAEVELMAEMIFARRLERLPIGEWYQKQSLGRLMTDGTGRRALALRHPDPLVEAVRFAICEGELLQAVGRGRGVRRNAEMPLEVLILTDVPLPIPVDTLITWKGLCDAGPLDVLAANGVIPLDYMGIVAALPGRFENETQLKDWFQKRPEARSKLKAVKRTARDLGTVDLCEFSDISHRESNMGKVAKLAAYRYRRAGSGQGSLVLVNGAMHADAQAAVEAVLGPVTHFAAVQQVPRRRPRQKAPSMDAVSQSVLDQLLGPRSADITGLRPFGRQTVDGQDRQ